MKKNVNSESQFQVAKTMEIINWIIWPQIVREQI